jgi:hypothetical protein
MITSQMQMPPLPSINLYAKEKKIIPQNDNIITKTKELKIGRSLDVNIPNNINPVLKDKDNMPITLKQQNIPIETKSIQPTIPITLIKQGIPIVKKDIQPPKEIKSVLQNTSSMPINLTQQDIPINIKTTSLDIKDIHEPIPPKHPEQDKFSNTQLIALKSGTSINITNNQGDEQTILPAKLMKEIHDGEVGDKFIVKNEDGKIYTFYKTQNMTSIKTNDIYAQMLNTDGKMRFAQIAPKPKEIPVHNISNEKDLPIDKKMLELEQTKPTQNTPIYTSSGKKFQQVSFDLYQNNNLYAKLDNGNMVFRGFRI